MALAAAADSEKIPAGINLPEEIARSEDRLKAIAAAKRKIEARAEDSGAGDRNSEVCDGISAILVTGSGKGQRRIEVGGDGVELEADVYPCWIV